MSTYKLLKRLTYRHQEKTSLMGCLRLGAKSFIALTFLSFIGHFSEMALLIAPFGASCILIFTMPESESSQPINVVGGYTVAILVSTLLVWLLPYTWWNIGLMLALTISAMAYFRVTHPPCGAIPLLTYFDNDIVLYNEIFLTIAGSILLVSIAVILHRIPPKRIYPKPMSK